jgi:hypothetical protein
MLNPIIIAAQLAFIALNAKNYSVLCSETTITSATIHRFFDAKIINLYDRSKSKKCLYLL